MDGNIHETDPPASSQEDCAKSNFFVPADRCTFLLLSMTREYVKKCLDGPRKSRSGSGKPRR